MLQLKQLLCMEFSLLIELLGVVFALSPTMLGAAIHVDMAFLLQHSQEEEGYADTATNCSHTPNTFVLTVAPHLLCHTGGLIRLWQRVYTARPFIARYIILSEHCCVLLIAIFAPVSVQACIQPHLWMLLHTNVYKSPCF
jgi:hypothetical protein